MTTTMTTNTTEAQTSGLFPAYYARILQQACGEFDAVRIIDDITDQLAEADLVRPRSCMAMTANWRELRSQAVDSMGRPRDPKDVRGAGLY
jgi:hypothetical protein